MLEIFIAATVAAMPVQSAAPPQIDLARFESEVVAIEEQDALNPPAQCQTLLVGSSSIRLWDEADRHFAFPALWRGVGGSTVAEIDHYFDRLVTPYNPSRIILYAGENDLHDGRSPAQVYDDLRRFVAAKRAALGGVPLYLLSAKPSVARAADFPAQAAYNRILAHYAENQGDIRYIDVETPMGGADVPADIFREDMLHMNARGYEIWTRVIEAALALPQKGVARGCQGMIATTSVSAETPVSPKASTATK